MAVLAAIWSSLVHSSEHCEMASILKKTLNKIKLPEEEQGDRWTNEDTLPVPAERQTWGKAPHLSLRSSILLTSFRLPPVH